MKYEQSKIYGGVKSSINIKYNGNQSFQYLEKFLITVGCPFEYNSFPFDSQECNMTYGSYDLATDVELHPPTIYYGNNFKTSFRKEPIILNSLPHPYQLQLESLQAFRQKWNDDIYSYTGISFMLRRKTLGHLSSGYFYPTGCFAVVSMISYLIKPDIVRFR